MLISTDEALARLEDPRNLTNRHSRTNDKQTRKDERARFPDHPDDHSVIRPLHNGGRRKGDTNLTDEVRAMIGAEGQLETLETIAEQYNISHHHAHELAAGKVYTEAGVDNQLVSSINTKLSVPHQLAVEKLTETLLALDSHKISSIGKAKDIASVAAQLSRIAEGTSPLKHKQDEDDAKGAARIIIYSPTIKQENHYSSIETRLAPSVSRE